MIPKIILVVSVLISIFVIDVNAQSMSPSQTVIKQETISCNSDYSIGYVKSGKKEPMFNHESDDRIWLKLTNKSKKTLQFKVPFRQGNADNLFKGNRDDLFLYYEVVDKENCSSSDKGIEELPLGYRRVETYFSINIKPKSSFVFSVAKQYFLPNRAIYLTYNCSHKCDKKEKDEIQKAYFFASALTVNILDK